VLAGPINSCIAHSEVNHEVAGPGTAFEETSGAMPPNGPFSAICRLQLMSIGLAAKGYPDLTDDFTATTTSVKSS
jgi:hypothetical protein